jgi:hypothetical protein
MKERITFQPMNATDHAELKRRVGNALAAVRSCYDYLAQHEDRVATTQPKQAKRYGDISAAVWGAVEIGGRLFRIGDVKGTLERTGRPLNKLQIATALARFAEQGRIRVVQEKRGNIGAIYERI